ncbi:MAG: hypothetical protein KTR18_10295 [Acidiferrobacterales bacterium]|nr:hypothetical protein [Acidiferrobacterales bacterium]
MSRSPLLEDLERALDLLKQVDETLLGFPPDPVVSEDIQTHTSTSSYPTESHRANMEARIAAVASAGDQLRSREPSEYVSNLIVACIKLAPPSDD